MMVNHNFWRQYIFFPERELWWWPEDYGLKYKEVWFRTSDRIRLYGWWIPKGTHALLFAHGNGGNISYRVDIAAKFSKHGLSVFLFDYRGYGKSEGDPTEQGTYQDAEAALRYLRTKLKIPLSRIVPVGESMGGAIVIELCTHYDFPAAVLISPGVSLARIMSHLYPRHKLRNKFAGIYDSTEKISKVRSPIMIIHGDADELVPFGHGKELFRKAKTSKVFYRIRGAGHNDIYEVGGERFFRSIREFVNLNCRKEA